MDYTVAHAREDYMVNIATLGAKQKSVDQSIKQNKLNKQVAQEFNALTQSIASALKNQEKWDNTKLNTGEIHYARAQVINNNTWKGIPSQPLELTTTPNPEYIQIITIYLLKLFQYLKLNNDVLDLITSNITGFETISRCDKPGIKAVNYTETKEALTTLKTNFQNIKIYQKEIQNRQENMQKNQKIWLAVGHIAREKWGPKDSVNDSEQAKRLPVLWI